MKKVDFEYFAPGQYIYYDVGRIIQIENLLKKGIGEIASEQALNMSSLCVMLTVGLRHHGFKSPDTIAPLLQKAMDDGVDIQDMQIPVVKALAASGALGKKVYYQIFPEELTEDKEAELQKEEAAKN